MTARKPPTARTVPLTDRRTKADLLRELKAAGDHSKQLVNANTALTQQLTAARQRTENISACLREVTESCAAQQKGKVGRWARGIEALIAQYANG